MESKIEKQSKITLTSINMYPSRMLVTQIPDILHLMVADGSKAACINFCTRYCNNRGCPRPFESFPQLVHTEPVRGIFQAYKLDRRSLKAD